MKGTSLALVFILTAALCAQTNEVDQLQRERYAIRGGTLEEMVVVQAVHEDGTPAKGTIACEGLWRKFDENPISGYNLPFVTDSRGVAIFNPWIGMFDNEGNDMTCSATDRHGHKGWASWPMPTSHATITVR